MIYNLKWHIVVGIEYKNKNYFLYVPHISRTYRCMFVLYTNVCLCMCVFGFVHEGGHSRNICVYYFMYMNICLLFFLSTKYTHRDICRYMHTPHIVHTLAHTQCYTHAYT